LGRKGDCLGAKSEIFEEFILFYEKLGKRDPPDEEINYPPQNPKFSNESPNLDPICGREGGVNSKV